MAILKRITTAYIENEDRIRMTGQSAGGDTVCLWLTRRITDRLLAALFNILAPAREAPGAEIFAQLAQQRAELQHTPQPAVPPPEGGSTGHLIQAVSIARMEGAIRLALRENGDDIALIALTDNEMRQWLAIVRQAYRTAEWPMHNWPDWVTEAAASQVPTRQLN